MAQRIGRDRIGSQYDPPHNDPNETLIGVVVGHVDK